MSKTQGGARDGDPALAAFLVFALGALGLALGTRGRCWRRFCPSPARSRP
jgi:hypothetical protein